MLRRLFSSPHLRIKALQTALSPSNPRFALTRHVTAQPDASFKKRVEDIMPIATGHEREEIQASLEGRDILEIDHPEGPFGTKEAPAIVKSYFDRRIVGCPGGEGEDEHDVVWFWLEKGKSFECPACSQYFEVDFAPVRSVPCLALGPFPMFTQYYVFSEHPQLEVVGPGGDPYGHGDHH